MATASIDYGYPWWLSYGHLTILVPSLAALALGYFRDWPIKRMLVLALVAAWAFASLFVVRSFGVFGDPQLPTENFLRSGKGRVLDIGAGTGRSSIMLLKARPETTLVASDLFAESYTRHFGHDVRPQDRLLANLKAAGVEQRASIETADMRKLPFPDASFDALVSAYAVDHVGGQGARQALGEAFRVLKPEGEFLLILNASDGWAKFAFGPLLAHGARGPAWWRDRAEEARFEILEEGTKPATLYLLLRRKPRT